LEVEIVRTCNSETLHQDLQFLGKHQQDMLVEEVEHKRSYLMSLQQWGLRKMRGDLLPTHLDVESWFLLH
jgi:hypothetical protein